MTTATEAPIAQAVDIWEVTIGRSVVGWEGTDGWSYSARLMEDESEDVFLRVKCQSGSTWRLPAETSILQIVAQGLNFNERNAS